MRVPDPLDMLDVIEESRQRAMATREAALEHMATVALQALVEGVPVKEIAVRCGFVAVDEVGVEDDDNAESSESSWSGALVFSSFMAGAPRRKTLQQAFASWLAEAVKKRVLEGLE